MITEVWKDITDYEGYYQVSNLGRVKSLKRYMFTKRGYLFPVKERILKNGFDKDGYHQVVLVKNRRRKTSRVHQLVAIQFIPNTNRLPIINHVNGIKHDNRPENIEWCTHQYNAAYTYSHLGRRGITYNKGKLGAKNPLSKYIIQMSVNNKKIKTWPGMSEASRNTGIQRSKIGSVCNGRRKTAGGFKWKFA